MDIEIQDSGVRIMTVKEITGRLQREIRVTALVSTAAALASVVHQQGRINVQILLRCLLVSLQGMSNDNLEKKPLRVVPWMYKLRN